MVPRHWHYTMQVLFHHKIRASNPFWKHAFPHAQPGCLLLKLCPSALNWLALIAWCCISCLNKHYFINTCGHRDSLTPFRICDGCFFFAVKAEVVTLLCLGSKWKVFSNALNQSRMYHRKHPKRKNEERRNIGCPIRNSLRWSPLGSKAQHFSCISLRQQELLHVLSSMRAGGTRSQLQDLEGGGGEQPLHQICDTWENRHKQGLGSSAAAITHPAVGLWSKNMETFKNHKQGFVTLMT